jgi:hypothetical protein
MPSAIQVKENEKRRHASLTIVGTKRDFAFTIRETERKPLQGGVTWGGGRKLRGVLCNDARYAKEKNGWEI